MSKTYKFIWIDDNPERARAAATMKETLKVSVKFISVKDQDLSTVLEEVFNGKEPDLLIIDHKLEDVQTGIFRLGSTAAAHIKVTWPACPIICVSAVNKNEVDFQQRLLYDEMYPISNISNHGTTILSIAKAHRKLKENPVYNLNDILMLMKAPSEDKGRLTSIIPKELKENFEDESLIHEISNWIRNTFTERPGFVFDKLGISTLLGIKESSFHKVEHLFVAAKYNGIFADELNIRWWKSKVLNRLTDLVTAKGLSWEKGRLLPNINKNDYSKCHVTNEDFPEIVAYVDQTKDAKRAAMKLKNTLHHPNYEDLLFFDEIRVMKPAE